MTVDALADALDEAVAERPASIAAPSAPRPAPTVRPAAHGGTALVDVAVDDLTPDPDNPRDDVGDITDLARSMASAGLIQPIIARRDHASGRLIVVAGHRRLAAAQHLGWTHVPVVVRPDMRPDAVLVAMLVENGQRRDLDPIEEARAFRRLEVDHGATAAQLGAMIGRHQTYVSGRLALLALDAEQQEQVRAKQLNVGDAIRAGRLASGRVKAKGSTGSPHLGVDHVLAPLARARCNRLKHNRAGKRSVGGTACGECWESVIRANEREHLHTTSVQRGTCATCGASTTGASA